MDDVLLIACSFDQRRDQFPAKGWNVRNDPTPNLVAIMECRFIHPGCSGIDQVILDAERTRRAPTAHDARRDRHQSAMTNDADGFLCVVHLFDEICYHGMSAQLIGRPAAGDDQREQITCYLANQFSRSE